MTRLTDVRTAGISYTGPMTSHGTTEPALEGYLPSSVLSAEDSAEEEEEDSPEAVSEAAVSEAVVPAVNSE